MKLAQLFETYYTFTDKASTNVRNLAFAGIAVIWVFKTGAEGVPALSNALFTPLLLLIISLTLDFAHYFLASAVYDGLTIFHEKRKTINITNSPLVVNILRAFFYSKGIVLLIAYVLLAIFAFSKIQFSSIDKHIEVQQTSGAIPRGAQLTP